MFRSIRIWSDNGNVIWVWLGYWKVLVTRILYGIAIIIVTIVEVAEVLGLEFVIGILLEFGYVFGICLKIYEVLKKDM